MRHNLQDEGGVPLLQMVLECSNQLEGLGPLAGKMLLYETDTFRWQIT